MSALVLVAVRTKNAVCVDIGETAKDLHYVSIASGDRKNTSILRQLAFNIQYSAFRSQPHTSALPPDVTALRILSRLSYTYSDKQHALLRPCHRLYHQWRSSV